MRPRIPAAKDEQREGAHPKANPKASRRPSEAKATIRATPKTGFAFDKWSDSNTQSVRTLTVNADLSLTASFKTASTGGGTDQGGNTDQGGGGSLGD